VLLVLSLVFMAVSIYCGRNWFLYATMYAGPVGHSRLDSEMVTMGHLETEWYWGMVCSAILVLLCWGLAALRLVRAVRADTTAETAE